MTLSLYLIGEPGVGKTSTMNAMLDGWHVAPEQRLNGSLWGHPIERNKIDGLLLGRQRDGFGGTDALAMNVSPHAIVWAQEHVKPEVVLGEGQRLSHLRFLAALAKTTTLVIAHLVATEPVITERIAERGSTQRESWRIGARTRAFHAAENARDAGLRTVAVLTDDSTPQQVANACWDLLGET